MQFSIKNPSLVKKRLQRIGKIMPEVLMSFEKEGINLSGINFLNTIAVDFFIPRKNLAGYKFQPIKSISINLSCLYSVLARFKDLNGELGIKITEDKIEFAGMDGIVRKKFQLSVAVLDYHPRTPEFEEHIIWNVEELLNGISVIQVLNNKGPLVIDSGRDELPIRWYVTPMKSYIQNQY